MPVLAWRTGIPTRPSIVASYTEYVKEIRHNRIPVGFYIMALGPNPHAAFHGIYGKADGYHLVGGQVVHYPRSNPAHHNWLNTATTLPLPTGGSINPGVLTNQLAVLPSTAQQKAVVQKLALATNQDLPMYTLWNYTLVEFENHSRFRDLPPSGSNLLQYQAGLWMWLGYVHPR